MTALGRRATLVWRLALLAVASRRATLVWRLALLAVAVLVVASAATPDPAQAAIVRVRCDGCDEWPVWVQAVLVLIGVGLALAVLYIPIKLSERARSPRNRSRIMIGGVVLALVALIAGARALVLLFPD